MKLEDFKPTRALRRSVGAVVAVATTIALTAAAVAQEPLNITIRGGPASGLYQLVGEGVANVIRQSVSSGKISYEPGSPAGNVATVARAEADLGLTGSIEVRTALRGDPPFQSKIDKGKLFVLARLFDTNLMQVFIRESVAKKHGIETLADLKAKKPALNVSVNRRGNVQNQILISELFGAYGFSSDDMKSWGGKLFYQNSGGTLGLLRDRKVDMFPVGLFAPDARFADLHRNVPLRLLPVGEDVAKKIVEKYGLAFHVIQPDAYPFLDKPYPTFGIDSMLIASAKLSEDAAYQLTKALAENADKVRAIHKGFRTFSPKVMASATILPYHPGAVKYYREAGLMPK